ncbi:KPN_02809 family neutral zinc metallopeptidase [Sphingomonas hengshuiensis]|uniref:Zinc metalloprotease n=1 Tax=Sphingomonas hengshuiensis TaxID=1609977 RepID=A0A7U5BFB0_9SPHN|nr:neutral zinc metallopeptidase [Sphingomonas hengshuiensis]AJP74195.1 zinc metalloprotease [Sphingomonas hengshuiensis]
MRLDDLDPTQHARDLGSGGGGGGGFGLLGLLPLLLGRGMGCGGIALIGIVALVYFAIGGGGGMLGTTGGSAGKSPTAGQSGASVCQATPERLEACRVMTSTEQTWGPIFEAAGKRYTPATINFFTGGAQTGCGAATSAVGPFYCPGDNGVYLDTAFFGELERRFGAKGDFARDYVIAHEVGHHVQNLLGTSGEVSRAQAQGSRTEGNRLSVLLELQADCYAGVWAGRNRNRLEPGDIEEGMTAANAIGDDTLQKEAQGRVVPDSFTHGTSAQRMQWLKRGLDSGDPAQCDTFAAAS